MKLAAMSGVLVFATACAHSPPAPMGRLRVMCCARANGSCPEPDTHSQLFLDGASFGRCGGWFQPARSVRAGRHHIEVEFDDSGYRDWQDFFVPEGGDVQIELGYDREPD